MIDSNLLSALMAFQSPYGTGANSSISSEVGLTDEELMLSAAQNPNSQIAQQDYSEINSLNAGEQELNSLSQINSLLGGSESSGSASYGNYNSLLSMLGEVSDDDDDDDDDDDSTLANELGLSNNGLFGNSSYGSSSNQLNTELQDAMLLSMLSQDSKASQST